MKYKKIFIWKEDSGGLETTETQREERRTEE